ncbi:MAG: hypothetical protein COB45_06410 [Gammaproteobacteria bacterium]|nr:MAG: hypothetical protein COB45_06410 [Gammaproteobacteria bacterium]PHR84629.1 MAG: hypothetical protein COA59_06695 [Colwellia sp.]
MIFSQIKDSLEFDLIPYNIRWLVSLFLLTTFLIVLLLCITVFSKFGESTKYTTSAKSEFFQYKPHDKNSSSILIKNYRTSFDCDEYSPQLIKETAVLNIAKGATLSMTRFGNGELKIEMLGLDAEHSAGNLETDYDETELPICFSTLIELNELNPVFSVNIIGDISIGLELTDANDAYFPILLEGEVLITDLSLITNSAYQLSPQKINKGEHLYFSENQSPSKGLIRAEYQSNAIDGVIFSNGGEVYIQQYRTAGKPIETSFLNRISDDNESVITFSILIIFIQFISFSISFLLRLKILKNYTEENQNEKAIDEIT